MFRLISIASFLEDCNESAQKETILNEQQGYLSLYRPLYKLTHPIDGFSPCPWTIVAEPGQRISISWALEAPAAASAGADVTEKSWLCLVVDFVDGLNTFKYSTCAPSNRAQQGVVYTSRTSQVGVRVTFDLNDVQHDTAWQFNVWQYTSKRMD